MNKIKFIHLLNKFAGLSLSESKSIKDRIVDGESIEISVDKAMCDFVVSQSILYGVDAITVD